MTITLAKRVLHFFLPLCGITLAVLGWWAASFYVANLPSPLQTWEESKIYILEPLAYRGETDQGIVRLAFDVLHYQVRLTVVGLARIDQSRDVRVIEARENLALGAEAHAEIGSS